MSTLYSVIVVKASSGAHVVSAKCATKREAESIAAGLTRLGCTAYVSRSRATDVAGFTRRWRWDNDAPLTDAVGATRPI